MRTTYSITKDDRGTWALSVSHTDGKNFPAPTLLGRHKTRKAAETTARLLAGRSADVVVFR